MGRMVVQNVMPKHYVCTVCGCLIGATYVKTHEKHCQAPAPKEEK
jgi:hypothetical protein